MDENKEWIYPEEPIALLSPSAPKVSAPASMPSSPASRRKTAAGLMICVAIFAIAFLLCDAMYAVRQTAVGHETEEWLTQLLAGSFAGAVGQESTASKRPVADLVQETAEPEEKKPESVQPESVQPVATATAPAESIPALTSEMLYAYDASVVPTGMIPIVPMDLSLTSYGESFCYNDTGYDLSKNMKSFSNASAPTIALPNVWPPIVIVPHALFAISASDV